MTLLSEGISNVRVFSIPAGIGADGCVSAAAIVKWDSQYDGKFYQVYVNGKFAGATVVAGQRKFAVEIPLSEMTAARVEVFAVDGDYAQEDFSDEIPVQQGRAELEFARVQSIPAGARVGYYFDNGSGVVDYDIRLNCDEVNIWPDDFDKGGFGLSCFGESDFGRDSSSGPGFGKGSFGQDEFGIDLGIMKWQSGQLVAGEYIFGVKLFDSLGNEAGGTETEPLKIIGPVMPARRLTVLSFDQASGEIIFSIE